MKFDHFGRGAKCQHCGGSGKAVDHADAGAWVKGLRQRKSLTLKQVAGLAGGISVQYLSDLEHGRRYWNAELFDRIFKAIEGADQ